MKLSAVLQSLAAASLVQGSPVAHLHHNHKREVVHVTETVMVTVEGDATAAVNAPAAVQTTVDSQTDGTATQYAYQVTTAPVAAAVDPSATSVEEKAAVVGTSTSATAAAASSDSTSDVSGSAGSIGITYSPYNSDGTCKDLSGVESDLSEIDDYAIIRLYGVDCNQVANVLQAKKSTQKLFLGIYYMDDIAGGVDTLASAIESYGSWDDVYTVSIGNELVNSGAATPAQIKEYVATGRAALTAKGYTGSVVSVDTHVAILNNTDLCEYSDYIAFNAHAYWDGTVTSSDAGPWLLLQMQRVASACGKHVMCVESGWPHSGSNNGVAVASLADQTAAISSLESTCGSDTIIFTAFDDLWKAPGSNGVEQYWGIIH